MAAWLLRVESSNFISWYCQKEFPNNLQILNYYVTIVELAFGKNLFDEKVEMRYNRKERIFISL